MRRIAVSLVVVALGSVVASASAEPPKMAPPVLKHPIPAPTVTARKIVLPPHVASAKKAGPAAYTNDAPLSFEVEVVNGAATPVDTHLVVTQLYPTTTSTPKEGGQVARVPVKIPANGRTKVTYQAAQGLVDGCNPNYHRLAVEGGVSTILKITPKCVFGVTTPNPEQGMAPDRIVGARENKVSYHTPRLVQRRLQCGAALLMDATVQNKTGATVSGANLRIVGPKGEVPGFEPIKYTLKAGETRKVETPSARFEGQPGRWTLKVGANVAPTKLHQMNFAAHVSRLCSMKTELTNTVTPLPKPAAQRGE